MTQMYSIKQAALELGVNELYVRKLIRDGKLSTQMVPVKPGSQVMKHLIPQAEIERHKAKGRSSSSRPDGRNKWVVYATPSEAAKLAEFCRANGLPEPVMPNKGEYERRKARQE